MELKESAPRRPPPGRARLLLALRPFVGRYSAAAAAAPPDRPRLLRALRAAADQCSARPEESCVEGGGTGFLLGIVAAPAPNAAPVPAAAPNVVVVVVVVVVVGDRTVEDGIAGGLASRTLVLVRVLIRGVGLSTFT